MNVRDGFINVQRLIGTEEGLNVMDDNQNNNPWRAKLSSPTQTDPRYVFPVTEHETSASALWRAASRWMDALSRARLCPGTRVVVTEHDASLIPLVLACFWERLTLVVLPETHTRIDTWYRFDPAVVVGDPETNYANAMVDENGAPIEALRPFRTIRAPTPDIRVVLRDEHRRYARRWVALSDRNVLDALEQSRPVWSGITRLLSTRSFGTAFGFVHELLGALISKADMVRRPTRPHDNLSSVIESYSFSHWNPASWELVSLVEQGVAREFVQQLTDGIVVDAPIDTGLRTIVERSQLRAGRSCAAASGLLCLGEKGEHDGRFMGRPLANHVRSTRQGEFELRGSTAVDAFWRADGCERRPHDEWIKTGIWGAADDRGLHFLR